MKVKNILLFSSLALTSVMSVIAESSKMIAVENFDGSEIIFSEKIPIENTTLTISGPNGFSATNSTVSGIPSIDLFDFGTPSDGRYKYHITSSKGEIEVKKNTKINNGRSSNNKTVNKTISQSGHFLLEGGQVKHFDNLSDSSNITSP